jgi:hypothetical protein
MKPSIAASALAAALAVIQTSPALAQTMRTNEAYIEEVGRKAELDVSDAQAVFAFVFGQLPGRVNVLPTENYYYFTFTHNGVPYTGNMRLSAVDRDQGKLHFSYGDLPNDWRSQISSQRLVLDASQGVTVEKGEGLTYRVALKDKSVTFALNDLSQHKPPDGLLKPDEILIGPVFDESAVRFFLVFNPAHKVFHYLLDEAQPIPDDLSPVQGNEDLWVGKRTGFAFYRDGKRKILVGANERNSQLNTWFDGPFDQLPENFIDGDVLRDAILAVEPSLKGKIDRFGNIEGREDRYLIHPYLLYRRLSDLNVFHRCLNHPRVPEAIHPRCFAISDEEAQKNSPLPMALIRRR